MGGGGEEQPGAKRELRARKKGKLLYEAGEEKEGEERDRRGRGGEGEEDGPNGERWNGARHIRTTIYRCLLR